MNTEKQKEILLEKKLKLEHELSSMGRMLNDNGDWVAILDNGDGETADELDNANIIEEYEENIAVFSILEERYHQINKALKALNKGNYGICEICQNSISEERLDANPTSTTCITHAK